MGVFVYLFIFKTSDSKEKGGSLRKNCIREEIQSEKKFETFHLCLLSEVIEFRLNLVWHLALMAASRMALDKSLFSLAFNE